MSAIGRSRGRCWGRCVRRACRSMSSWCGRGPGRRCASICAQRPSGMGRAGTGSCTSTSTAPSLDLASGAAETETGQYQFATVPANANGGGRKPVLFFETGEEGRAEAVSTDAVAELLVEHRVPVAVMNACQSAMQAHESEASLAQRLVEAGVPVALGMAYSVTVSAAELMMPVVYGQLAEGSDLLAAVHAGRRRLFDHKPRRAYFDQQLALEDWVLPVVFWQRPVQIQPALPTPEQQAAIFERQARLVDEPSPEYGFVGRDLDVQAIERRLLSDAASNELLVHGLAGAGKSTLLEHLGWWWQATGLVGEVFRFSYEDRAWTANQIVQAIAERLHGSRRAGPHARALRRRATRTDRRRAARRPALAGARQRRIDHGCAGLDPARPAQRRAGTPRAAAVALARRPLARGRRLARPGTMAGTARVRGQRLRTRRPRPPSRLNPGRADPRPPRRRTPGRPKRTRRPASAAGGARRLPTAPHRRTARARGSAALDAAGRTQKRR